MMERKKGKKGIFRGDAEDFAGVEDADAVDAADVGIEVELGEGFEVVVWIVVVDEGIVLEEGVVLGVGVRLAEIVPTVMKLLSGCTHRYSGSAGHGKGKRNGEIETVGEVNGSPELVGVVFDVGVWDGAERSLNKGFAAMARDTREQISRRKNGALSLDEPLLLVDVVGSPELVSVAFGVKVSSGAERSKRSLVSRMGGMFVAVARDTREQMRGSKNGALSFDDPPLLSGVVGAEEPLEVEVVEVIGVLC
jgi:hypothetical protein